MQSLRVLSFACNMRTIYVPKAVYTIAQTVKPQCPLETIHIYFAFFNMSSVVQINNKTQIDRLFSTQNSFPRLRSVELELGFTDVVGSRHVQGVRQNFEGSFPRLKECGFLSVRRGE